MTAALVLLIADGRGGAAPAGHPSSAPRAAVSAPAPGAPTSDALAAPTARVELAGPVPHAGRPAAPAAPAPVAVALDPALTRPQPGDSAATRAARRALASAQTAYDDANQRYDQAEQAARAAAGRLQTAQQDAAAAQVQAVAARRDLLAVLIAQYEGGSPVPVAARVMLSAHGADLLERIGIEDRLAAYQADRATRAVRARRAAAAAAAVVTTAQRAADAAERAALTLQRSAAGLVQQAQAAVAALHTGDLAAAAAARAAGDDLAGAARALREQAIASGAATTRSFPHGATAAVIVDLAVRALLDQAAGRGPAPPPAGHRSAFRATNGPAVDETAVMGPTPDLGATAPWTGATGTGSPTALTLFDGTVSTAGWPYPGVGTAVPGTAPFRPADGVTVHPALPGYPANYRPLRAQVAVDSAIAQLGSPYVWNAAGPTTFDCSGLTLWAWGHAGVALGHYTGTQVGQGSRVAPGELLPGDLVLFGSDLHHVGLYLGAGYMIDAPHTGDYVKIQKVSDGGDFAVAVRP